MSSVRAKQHAVKPGNVDATSVADHHEPTTFLFTSESVGEGHPGEQNHIGS